MKPMTNATPYILKVITNSQDHRYNKMHHLRHGLQIKLIKPNSQIGLEFCSGTNYQVVQSTNQILGLELGLEPWTSIIPNNDSLLVLVIG